MANHGTPLRYPGGKQRLTPFIEELLAENSIIDGNYVEPYAGGAGVAIQLLLSKKVSTIHLNDSDFGIYSFWYSILNKPEEFCSRITRASLTVEEWRLQKEIVRKGDKRKKLDLGFSIFYLNRCNRSGVLSGGLIGGVNQTGNYKMDARFSRNELIRRIEVILKFKDNIFLENLDAETYIKQYIPTLSKNTLVYLDPPYYNKGSQLYLNAYNKNDHKRISEIIQKKIKHKWVLSYDGVPDIIKLYDERRHFLYDLQYSAAKSYKGKEIFIFSDKTNVPEKCELDFINQGLKNLING